METVVLKRQLKVHCPTHQTIFEVEEKPQILCEIREHALSNDFPNAEYWEFCADCQTFSPTEFGLGGKALNDCRHCGRTIIRRFLCDECKIVSYESDEATKGKYFGISQEGVTPDCPGCRKSFVGAFANQHICKEIESSLMTHRAECPFCLKLTFEKSSTPTQVELLAGSAPTADLKGQISLTQCPNCTDWGFAGRVYCGKCGKRLQEMMAGVTQGTDTARTQLLGSICPNCGTGNQAGSHFCNNCGQALKVVAAAANVSPTFPTSNPLPPPPPPPPPPPNFQTNKSGGTAVSAPETQQTKRKSSGGLILAVIGVLFGLIFIGVLVAYNGNSSKVASGNSANNAKTPPRSTPAKNTAPANNMYSNAPAANTAASEVGREGRLTTNLNIRSAPSRIAEIRGTHYEDARIEVLDKTSFYDDRGEYVIWYKVRVLQDGCDRVANNGCGNNWERNGTMGYGEAEKEGWMNSKYIILD